MRNRKFALLSIVALAMALAAAPSALAIPTTFGQFVQASGGQMFSGLYNSAAGSNSVTASGQVFFFFLVPVPAALQGPQLAHLSLTATSHTAPTNNGPTTNQDAYTGFFTITLATPYGGQSNLLSGTFGDVGGNLTGPSNGNSATLEDSVPPIGEVVFTSDFLNFDPNGVQAFSFSLSSVIANFSRNTDTGYLNPFTAAGSGTFSADMGIPEPAVLVLVGSGLLALGFLRRRKHS